MNIVSVQDSLERAKMVSQVFSLTVSANSLFVQSAMVNNPEASQELFKAAQVKINQADQIRDAFWDKYPKAFVPPNCPWMNKREC